MPISFNFELGEDFVVPYNSNINDDLDPVVVAIEQLVHMGSQIDQISLDGEVDGECRNHLRETARLFFVAASKVEELFYDDHDGDWSRYLHQIADHFRSVASKANQICADHAFALNNPHYDALDRNLALSQIDLHGLQVVEAMQRMAKHLQMCEDTGIDETVIICGWGKGSRDGIPKIKPELLRDFQERDINHYIVDGNPGRLVVIFPKPLHETNEVDFLT